MSIPKEPRQLMINLMYIVLTAMLAMNVSAEILNAFLAMDKSITESSGIVSLSNSKMVEAISKEADAYPQFEAYRTKAQEARRVSQKFDTYVSELKEGLIEAGGGYDEEGRLKGIKNKDITTRMLVDEGQGDQLESTVIAARAELLALIEADSAREILDGRIPLKIDPIPTDSDKNSWAAYTFQQMPLAAALPLLSKFQNDMQVAETAVLNHFYKAVHGNTLILNEYEAVISADKSYVIMGEELDAQIFLGAYSSTTDNLSITVNGRSYPVRNGKANFKAIANKLGTSELDVRIGLTNPKSGDVKYFTKKFRYEVGERSVAVSADKMNVFYAGVENPISVSAAGVPSDQVRVKAAGVELRRLANGKYVAKPKKSGRATITVSGGGLPPTTFDYRIKPIPNPVIYLGSKLGGNMKVAEMKVHKGLRPVLEGFDFDANCKIQGFEMVRAPKGKDVQVALNRGGNYGPEAKRIIKNTKRNDTYYFDKIKVKCPGDEVGRQMNGLIFHIK